VDTKRLDRPSSTDRAWSRRVSLATFAALVCLIVVPAASAKPGGGGTGGTLKINAGSLYTSVTAVTINSSMSGVTQMRFSNGGGVYTAWEPYSTTKAWTLLAGEGAKTISGQYKSNGKATLRTASISLDTTSPTLATLTSSSHLDEAFWYPSGDVTMEWTAAADVSGVTGYSWALDANAATDPDMVSEGSSTTATVSGLADGVWYFHVRARDAAGNWGNAIHRTVRIDTTTPATTDNSDGLPHTLVTLVFSSADSLSGVVATEWRIDGGDWTSGASVTLRRSVRHKRGDLLPGTHIVDYRSIDASGNVEAYKTCSVTIQ